MPAIRRRKAGSRRPAPPTAAQAGRRSPHDYDRDYCIDLVQLGTFLGATQPQPAESLVLDNDGPTRRKFLARLQGEISRRGAVDVLRHGVRHGAHDLDLFYGAPSAGNPRAQERFEQNRFTVVRQLRYSRDETQRALDIGLFIKRGSLLHAPRREGVLVPAVQPGLERRGRQPAQPGRRQDRLPAA